jgi:very-short-patch-repair endonuclease
VILRRQLDDAGVKEAALNLRLASGQLARAARGVYVVPQLAGPWTPAAIALTRCPGAALAGESAAALWEIDAFDRPSATQLARPTLIAQAKTRLEGVRETGRADEGTTLYRELRVTDPARTLGELGVTAGPDRIERALECCLRRGWVTVADVDAWLDAHPGRAWPGSRTLLTVLDRRGRHHPPTESDAETLFVQLARRAGLPDPVRQYVIGGGGRWSDRVDFFFPTTWGGLMVEVDGSGTHSGPSALQYDLSRQNRLLAPGTDLLRFTYHDIVERRRWTARQVARRLRPAA